MSTILAMYVGVRNDGKDNKDYRYLKLNGDNKITDEALTFGRKLHKTGRVGTIVELENTEGTKYRFNKEMGLYEDWKVINQFRAESEAVETTIKANKLFKAELNKETLGQMTLDELRKRYLTLPGSNRTALLVNVMSFISKY